MAGVNNICSDKTGTLTQNKMTVSELYYNQQQVTVSEAFAKQALGVSDLEVLAQMFC